MNTLLASAPVLAGGFSLDKDTVTPGVMGFLAIFVIGVALYFLMRNMLGKLRGVAARAEETEETAQASERAETAEPETETSGVDVAAAESTGTVENGSGSDVKG
ncbi:hypothetical protein [Nocardiopsis sp. MG754419]|uniref:hypothetical protein n=1 Tax=Nocardiopsis sp. MG754419 TaxID=2259865 RepID=UPI001BA98DE7|nr:hypothetical protein [Nocardiopsis sp. MG754419]MBR8744370.1 hypothetical protein [Nocardiopsis sp. MG754419]